MKNLGGNMMNKIDYKKMNKDLYQPKKPCLIEVPIMNYAVVEGHGDPNQSPDFQEAISLLYSLSYTIKMDKEKPDGYFDFVVPPLEGLWWLADENFDGLNINDKNNFHWLLMIRMPEFVDVSVFDSAKEKLKAKKPDLSIEKLYFRTIDEGLCVQTMHKGSFDLERQTILEMKDYMKQQGYEENFYGDRMHHEIYLSDFRRTKTENLKTVIRHPVKKALD